MTPENQKNLSGLAKIGIELRREMLYNIVG